MASVDALHDERLPHADSDALEQELAALIVATLQLEVAPGEIAPDEPLFGDGLGLDSIDALELALAISRQYGFELRSDDERNKQIFASLRNLARHIARNRTR
jgi:acyl carrier protein